MELNELKNWNEFQKYLNYKNIYLISSCTDIKKKKKEYEKQKKTGKIYYYCGEIYLIIGNIKNLERMIEEKKGNNSLFQKTNLNKDGFIYIIICDNLTELTKNNLNIFGPLFTSSNNDDNNNVFN
jgi:hypothetical protein